jgi:transposase
VTGWQLRLATAARQSWRIVRFRQPSTGDLRGIDARLHETRKKLAVAVAAACTSLTRLSGVGPVIAAAVIGDVRDVSRFGSRDRFAACNGTAPIEVSSGQRKVHRLSRRGNRRLNHAIHIAAIIQIRDKHSEGRAYYDKKLAGGKTSKQALRSLKRQVSNAIFACLQAGARRAAARAGAREGSRGTALPPARPACTPGAGSSDKPLPDPVTTLRPRPAAARARLRVPRPLPARSAARTSDPGMQQDDGHTRPPHHPRKRPMERLDTQTSCH